MIERIVRRIAGAVAVLLLVSSLHAEDAYYVYQGKKVNLSDTQAQIAVKLGGAQQSPGSAAPIQPAAAMAMLGGQVQSMGIVAADLKEGPLPGWVTVDVNGARARAASSGVAAAVATADTKALVEEMAAQASVAFVSPVFADPEGDPVIVTPTLLVGYRKNAAGPAQAAAVTQAGSTKLAYQKEVLGVTTYEVDSKNGYEVLDAASEMLKNPAVLFAEPDFVVTCEALLTPNDPQFNVCWGLKNTGQSGGLAGFDMGAETAWNTTTGVSTVKVVVFDTGIQLNHPDLNVLPGRDFTPDSANNPEGGPYTANDKHGTAVAGCIVSRINNGTGAVGIAPNVRVYPARITYNPDSEGRYSMSHSWFVNALSWAQSIGAKVTNNSNSFGTSSSAIDTAYTNTRNAGMVHFASAGNNSTSYLAYPSSSPAVNSVAAANRSGNRASFSQYGDGLDFTAPGQSICTADRTGAAGYDSGATTTINGTSFSSPYAAGVAALILSQNPNLTPAQVEARMRTTARDMGPAGYDTGYGWGLVNAAAALAGTTPDPTGPPNDNFANRATLTGANASATGNSASATKQAGEPAHAGDSGGKSVWWTWTAPAAGSVTISTAGSDFDTLLAVYTGSTLSALVSVASNDDDTGLTSRVTFTAQAGVTYQIAVDGYAGDGGNITLSLAQVSSAPSNDRFASAATLAGSGATASGSNVGAAKESGEPNHAGASGGKSVWWRWTAPSSGEVTIDTAGSDFDTLLAVYTGTSVSSLTTVASDDDGGANNTSVVRFTAQAGVTYRIAVDGWGGASGTIALSLAFVSTARPANDDFANATVLTGAPSTAAGTNVSASREANEPRHASLDGGASVWWRWTAPASGIYSIDTAGSSFDTVLGVYTGSSVGSLREIASNDDDPEGGGIASFVRFQASAGTTYRIAVDGYGAATGSIALAIRSEGSRIISLFGDLSFGAVSVGSFVQRTLTITNSGNLPLNVSGISLPAGGYSASWTSGTIDAGSSRDVVITFSPVAAGSFNGQVSVQSDATAGTATSAVSGTGIAAATRIIELSGNGNGGSLDFGSVPVGGSAERELTIRNSGNAALTVESVDFLMAGYTSNFEGPRQVAPGGSLYVTIRFEPTSEGGYDGDVAVVSDATDGMSTLVVWGQGISPTRIIDLSGTLNFGGIIVGSTRDLSATITNSGNMPLEITGIDVPSGFSTDLVGAIIDPGSSLRLVVTFSPDKVGPFGGSLVLRSNATSGTDALDTTGFGVPAPPPAEYRIALAAGPNGAITPAGEQIFIEGGQLTFRALPEDGYMVDSWIFNGQVIQQGGALLVLRGVTQSGALQVTFRPLDWRSVFFDDFDDNILDAGKWSASGANVMEISRILQLSVPAFDTASILSRELRTSGSGLIEVTREVFLDGSGPERASIMRLLVSGTDSFGVFYTQQPSSEWSGIYLFRMGEDGSGDQMRVADVPWQQWFTEKLVYDYAASTAVYFLNGVQMAEFTMKPPAVLLPAPLLRLQFETAGVSTPQYYFVDDVNVRIAGALSPESTEPGVRPRLKVNGGARVVVSRPAVRITGQIQDPDGMFRNCTAKANGEAVAVRIAGTRMMSFKLRATHLRPGRNRVVIVVRDVSGRTTRKAVQVRYVPAL